MNLFSEIKELIQKNKREELRKILLELSSPDIAELVEELESEERKFIFSLLPVDVATDVFENLNIPLEKDLLQFLNKKKQAEILNEMSPDDRADLFLSLPDTARKALLPLMEREEAEDVKRLLVYEPDTAGGLMTTEFASVHTGITVSEAIEELRENAKDLDFFYYVYVLNKEEKPRGIIPLKDMVMRNPSEPIDKVMDTHMITCTLNTNQEKVARLFSKYDIPSMPVVDRNGRMRGIITVDDVIDVIEEEDTEDMYRFGAAGNPPEEYFLTNVKGMAKQRLVWLIILVFAGFISGGIIQHYSSILQMVVILVAFIPVLTDSGGNAGTQAAAAVIRGIAIGEIKIRDIWRVTKREFLTGVIVGAGLGALTAVRALFTGGNVTLGVIVGSSMMLTVALATALGGFLPLLFKKLGFDPALMSGPFLTTVVDATSLVIYFEIARRILQLAG